MELVYNENSEFVLVFEKGEHYMESFEMFLKDSGIDSAFFHGLGGFTEAKLSFYDLEDEEYKTKKFGDGPYEVASLIGNVSKKDGEIMVHNHVVLGDREYNTVAGHLESAVVAGTLEIHINVLEEGEGLKRKPDKETGLDLIRKPE